MLHNIRTSFPGMPGQLCMPLIQRIAFCYPLLAAVAPILYIGGDNLTQIRPYELYLPTLVTLIGTALVYVVSWLLWRDLRRAAVWTCVLVAAFFSYGHVFDRIFEAEYVAQKQTLSLILGSAYLAALAVAALVLWRNPPLVQTTSQVLAVMSIVFFGLCAREFYREARKIEFEPEQWAFTLPEWAGSSPQKEKNTDRNASPPAVVDANQPDIYYIILDGYARSDVLLREYDFDNSAFTNALEERGFYIAQQSCSNYPMTFLSLTSSLNMSYLQPLLNRTRGRPFNRHNFFEHLQSNRVTAYLKHRGYRYVHCGSNYDGTATSPEADVLLKSSSGLFRSEFSLVLLRSTALRSFAPDVARSHLQMFKNLESVPELPGPKFTFAHVLMPHSPYVFDRHGNAQFDVPLDLHFSTKTGGWKNKEGYLEQMLFLNKKVEALVDTLQTKSKRPPVIIIQADHGSATKTRAGDPAGLYRERMSILNAYYGPPEFLEQLRPDITPVNTFRTLFASLFGAKFQTLQDRSYFAWYSDPLNLIDVTDQLKPTSSPEVMPVPRLAN